VAFQNFEEVWAALGRLYTDVVRLQESQQHLVNLHTQSVSAHTEQMKQVTDGMGRLTSTVATLAGTVTQLASIVDSHERRLERLEGP
jgi:adenine-specific DNA glycosylase